MFGSAMRSLTMLRRIAKALEDGNEIQRERLAREFPQRAKAAKIVVSRPSVKEWNEGRMGRSERE